MGQRGRRPLPTNLKLIKGTRPDRINKDEPKVEVSVPDAPDFLSDAERAVFTEQAKKLAKMRVMSDADVDALAIYAVNWCMLLTAWDQLRDGVIVKSKKGEFMYHPQWGVKNRCEKICSDILKEFGLTPSSRTKVQV